MRIFVSYASENRELADQVHLALTGRGHTVFFDRDSLPPGGDYHERIRAILEQSDVFVFLISPNSVSPGSYALTELKYARDKWPHPKGAVLPVIVQQVPWESIPSYLKAVTVLEPEGNVPAEVLLAVSGLEAEQRKERQTPPPGMILRRYQALPRRPDFIGRIPDLEAVLASLKHERSWLTSIEGIPGIGKTALAIEAAHSAIERSIFEAVVYTSAQSYDLLLVDLVDAIVRTLAELESNEIQRDIAMAHNLLSDRKTLLVIDNFETLRRDYAAICNFLRDLPAPSKALITSRRLEPIEATHVPLKGMAHADVAEFIAKEWTKLFQTPHPEIDHQLLREATGGNPHFIKLALSQLRKGIHLDRIIQFLRQAKGEPFKFYDDLWEQIEPDGRLVLMTMPLFATPPAWHSLLETTGLSEERLETVVEHLSELLLLEPWDETGALDRRYHAHPLTINYAKARLDQDLSRREELQERFVVHFLDLAERHGYRSWKEYHVLEKEQKNIFAAMRHLADVKDWKGLTNIAIRIRHFVIRQDRSRLIPYNRLGEYFSQAVDVSQRGIEAAAKAGDLKSECRLLIELGNIEIIRGNLETARVHLVACLEKARKISYHTREFMALRRLGHIEARRGNTVHAEKLYNQSLDAAQAVEDGIGVSRALRALGDLRFERNQLDEALGYYEKSLNAVSLDVDSIGVPRVVRRLGNIHFRNGDLASAAKHFRKSVDLYIAKYDISGMCYSFYGLGRIQFNRGQVHDSLTCSLGSLRILGCIHAELWPTLVQQLTTLNQVDFSGVEPTLETYVPTIDKTMRLCLFQLFQIQQTLGVNAFKGQSEFLIEVWDSAKQNWLDLAEVILTSVSVSS